MKRRGMLKETRKVTSRNRAHRWRISSLRPRRGPAFVPLHPPRAPAHLKPRATFGYTSVWRILHESEKWASSWFLKVKNERVPRARREQGAKRGERGRREEPPSISCLRVRGPFLGPVSFHHSIPLAPTNTRWCSNAYMKTIRGPIGAHTYARTRLPRSCAWYHQIMRIYDDRALCGHVKPHYARNRRARWGPVLTNNPAKEGEREKEKGKREWTARAEDSIGRVPP